MLKKKIFLPIMVGLILTLTACSTDDVEVEANPDTPPVEDETTGDITDDTTDETTDDITEEDSVKSQTDEEVSNDILENNYGIKIRPEEVFDIYMEKHPDTKVRKIQLDEDNNKYIYKIKGYAGSDEYEVKIDSLNGDIIKEETDREDDLDENGEITKENIKKIEELVNKVLNDAGENSRLDEWTLKAKNGRAELEIEVDRSGADDFEHTYDVETGELLEIDD